MGKSEIKKLVERALEIQAELEANKPLYAELDDITEELVDAGVTEVPISGGVFRVVDNFADKNVVFRPAAVRRHEIKVERKKAA